MSSADGTTFHTVTVDGNAIAEITANGNIVFLSDQYVIENFETNNMDAYYDPITGSVGDTTEAAAKRGTYGLHLPDGTADAPVSFPNELQFSGQSESLNTYPQRGDTSTVWFNLQTWTSSSSTLRIMFANQWDSSNRNDQFMLILSFHDDPDILVRLRERVDGVGSNLESATWSSHTTGDWYGFEITWYEAGEFAVDLIDESESTILSLGPVTPTTDIPGGGLGWRTNADTEAYFDEWIGSERDESVDYGSWFFAAPSDSSGSTSEFQGVVFEPLTSFSGVDVWIDWQASGFTRGLLYEWDADAGTTTLVENEDISGLSGGDWFTITHAFDSSTDYLLGLDANGSSYTRARGPFSRPTDSADFAITNGVYNDNPSTPANEYRYNIRTVRSIQ